MIFVRLFGLYFSSHQSCTSSTLLLRKEIYPRKSFTNLYQLIFNAYYVTVIDMDSELPESSTTVTEWRPESGRTRNW